MVCIYCGAGTAVTNSRLQKKTNQVWRRRKCLKCGNVYSSIEGVNWGQAVRYSHEGRLEPFSRDRLFLSLYEACRHRKSAQSDATALTDTVLGKLRPRIQAASLDRGQVIDTAMKVLKQFDKAAATAYRAYHPLEK
jgi:transcriptional repressor NrdR